MKIAALILAAGAASRFGSTKTASSATTQSLDQLEVAVQGDASQLTHQSESGAQIL